MLTGAGCFSADVDLPNQVQAVVLRSPHAHAIIERIDVAPALQADGVLAVYTSDELLGEGIKAIDSQTGTDPFRVLNHDGSAPPLASQYPLAIDRVRYVGEPVAVIVAETPTQAQDAAELVEVDYRDLPAVTDLESALGDSAPRVWPALADNRSAYFERGERAAVEEIFRSAARCVELEILYPRSTAAFMEPRAAVAEVEPDSGRLVLHAGCQSAHRLRDGLADIFNLPADRLRVIVPDVGGGFGARINVYPEYVALLFAARALGRPVKWVGERSESFLSDSQARSQRIRATLGLDAEGRFLAIKVAADWCHGAYLAPRALYVLANALPPMLCGAYRMKAVHFSLRGTFTNTTPVASYRGVGRAEAAYMIERLVDEAARQTGIDPAELRRRNMILPEEMPWQSPSGALYEPAAFPRNLELGLEAIDWAGFPARRDAAAARGRLRGRGLALYVMSAGGVPEESAELLVTASGPGPAGPAECEVAVRAGTQDFGMGHQTSFAQIVADSLGVPPAQVRLIYGDSDAIAQGAGGHGSRCLRVGGNAIRQAAEAVIDQGRVLAAELLGAAPADLSFEDGAYLLGGTNRHMALAEVALVAADRDQPLAASRTYRVEGPSYPNGCHLCEVELDPETGALEVVGFATVVDPGLVINPTIVEGQVQGGVVQGLGEALFEQIVFDPESGQPLAGSFLDYPLVRADDLPMIATRLNPVANADNPLGVKGVGEAGTTGSAAALVNAVRDALAENGPVRLDMPLTPERLWRAIKAAGAA